MAFFVEELFEIVLSYVTQCHSVGGFLSHEGCTMDMVGGSGSIIVFVFGNIFVMALEGMIVGIQVLRLQFYEMFSRYYKGNGVVFNALNQ